MPRTALLVIDAQKIYTSKESEMYCKDSKATIKKINSLIEYFQSHKALILLVRHIHSIDGSDLGRMFDYTGEPEDDFNFKDGSPEVEYDENLLRPAKPVELVKRRYSAFAGTSLESLLREKGIHTVVVCGFMTNFCCDSTAREAHDRDFFVDFIIDATGTPGTENLDEQEIRRVVTDLLGAGYARIWPTSSYLRKARL